MSQGSSMSTKSPFKNRKKHQNIQIQNIKTSKYKYQSSPSPLVILIWSCVPYPSLLVPSEHFHGLNSIFQLLDVRRWRHAPGPAENPNNCATDRSSDKGDSCDYIRCLVLRKLSQNQGHLYWSPRYLQKKMVAAYAQLLTLRRILENDLELLRFTMYKGVSISFTISEPKKTKRMAINSHTCARIFSPPLKFGYQQ